MATSIKISSISDVKLKFVFSRTAITSFSAKYIRAFLRLIILSSFILSCRSSYFNVTYFFNWDRDIFTIFSKVRRLDAKHLWWLISQCELPYSGAQGEILKTQSNKLSINWQVIKYRNPFQKWNVRKNKRKWLIFDWIIGSSHRKYFLEIYVLQ